MENFDLGRYSRTVTTTAPEAQAWFDQGLNWLYGFNHEAAIVCFKHAVAADHGCGMAHWGIAHGIGPNYNKQWEIFEPDEKVAALAEAHRALDAANAAMPHMTPVEQALITARAAQFPTDPEIADFTTVNDAFAIAMREVYKSHPTDLDVTAIFAEALMNRTPWQLWDLPGRKPAKGASTLEAKAALEQAFDRDPAAWDHPGLLHMYIHLMEMSPTPELALRHGDRLVDLVPDSGHLAHMATHIDVLCGDYQNVVWRNTRAATVDAKYFDHAGGENFYTVYRIHNLHFQAYGAMFLAQPTPALAACQALKDTLPDQVVRFLPDLFEAFVAMTPHILVRFGRWKEIMEQPLPEDTELYCYTAALWRYARCIAQANLGNLAEAEAERNAFQAASAKVPDSRMMFNNTCNDVLKVAEQMMLGELAYKSGRIDEGLAHLRASVALDDTLLYDEPWGWMQPTRHALGALLLDQGQFTEAEAIYRADLGLDDSLARACQHPRNIWSLHGLHECLQRRGEAVEIVHVKQMLDQATARAEVPVRASCFCRARAA